MNGVWALLKESGPNDWIEKGVPKILPVDFFFLFSEFKGLPDQTWMNADEKCQELKGTPETFRTPQESSYGMLLMNEWFSEPAIPFQLKDLFSLK